MSREAQKNHVSVRLAPEIMDRIDAVSPLFSTAGHAGTRSDVVREFILSGLEHLNDAESAKQPERDDDRKTKRRAR